MAYTTKKYLDVEGLQQVIRLLDEYPDNQILSTVIDEIEGELDKKYEKPSTGIPASDLESGTIPSVPVQNVQINGTSILQSGVANIPVASASNYGAVKVGNSSYGIKINSNGILYTESASASYIKAGSNSNLSITPSVQHTAVFYGLAKAAGDATQSASSNAVGTYTDGAKTAIKTMLGIDSSLALGTTSSTAFRGDYGNTAYQHASAKGSEFSSGLYKIATNTEGHVTAATAVAKEDITALGIPAQDTTYTFDGTYNASTNKAATVQTVTNAIGALDGGTIGTGGTGKTITSLTQTDGNVSATFADISITKSQVSDLGTIGAAAEKGVDTSITAGSTSTNLPTSGAVASFVEGQQKRGNATIFVGRCDSGADTSTKVVDCPDYDQLVNGDIIYVHFSYTNNVQPYSLKLNVNSTGAKDIKTYSSTYAYVNLNSAKDIRKGVPVKFLYMGGYWVMDAASKIKVRDIENEVASKTLLVADQSNATDADASVGMAHYVSYSSGKLYVRGSEVITADKVRGNAKIFVGTCDTDATTAAKVVTCSDYDSLVVGDKIYVTFPQGNTVYGNNITLNVNNKGAKQIRVRRANNSFDYLPEPATLGTGGEYLFTYDGTYWILTASSIAYTQNISQYDSKQRPLIVGNNRTGNTGHSTQSLGETYDVYYSYGKLYVNGSELLNEYSDAFKTRLGKIDVSDIMHDQYLDNLQSSNHYRAVLRIFFVTPNGRIFAKDQESRSEFFDYNNSGVSIKAYDSSNNVVETYYDDELTWDPWNWDTSWDGSDVIMTEYWMEFPFEFDASDTDIDHISVSFSGLNSSYDSLSMYNPNQNLNFNCHPTNHETVEIKNVGLIYGWWDGYKGNFRETGFTLPEETVNVPQRWAEELNEAQRVRGYSFEIYNKDEDTNQWYTVEGDNCLPVIQNTIVGYNNNLYYTNGYFLIPITESSGNYVQSNQGVANAGKVLAVNLSGVVEPASMNAVESNQGVANAGKFLVVNSSGVVEPVSMTAWQGGSY